mmetsp:Transcript_137188/g.438717  ORF Transcript_137188/g.438717 Transcript_137188/m.438717 type:complete len:201 (-) Transcript_137188:587-1189(-)
MLGSSSSVPFTSSLPRTSRRSARWAGCSAAVVVSSSATAARGGSMPSSPTIRAVWTLTPRSTTRCRAATMGSLLSRPRAPKPTPMQFRQVPGQVLLLLRRCLLLRSASWIRASLPPGMGSSRSCEAWRSERAGTPPQWWTTTATAPFIGRQAPGTSRWPSGWCWSVAWMLPGQTRVTTAARPCIGPHATAASTSASGCWR